MRMSLDREAPTTVFYLAARNSGKIDALLPLLVHLGADKSKFSFYTVVLFENTHEDLGRSVFHLEAVTNLSTYFRPFSGVRFLGPLRGILKLSALFLLLVRLFARGQKLIVLVPWRPKSAKEKALFWLLSRFGRLFHYPSLQLPATEDLMLRFTNWAALQEMGVKRKGKFDLTPKFPVICYLDSEKQYHVSEGFPEPVAIGIPRLYSSWIPFVRSFGALQLSRALQQIGLDPDTPRFGVVILTNPSYHWFPNGDSDYPAMLREIIDSSRRHFPGMPILLKPKPNMRGLFETLLRVNGLLDDVHLIDLGLAALASRAAWAATINESSGSFDFLCTNVPTIEYARYAPHWLEITPSGSAWRSLPGLNYVESREALDQAMSSTSRGELAVDNRQRLAEFFGHKENLELFFQ
jgi:hypothetical protein